LDQQVVTQKIQLLIVDSIAAVLVKVTDCPVEAHWLMGLMWWVERDGYPQAHELTFSQREHQLQRIAARLKFVGDVHRVFVVVTNRATTVESECTCFWRCRSDS
jgi:hypothetical protein